MATNLTIESRRKMAKQELLPLLYLSFLAALVLSCYSHERKVYNFLIIDEWLTEDRMLYSSKNLEESIHEMLLTLLEFLSKLISFIMQVHIIYMGEKPQGDISVTSMHHSMLARVLGRLLNCATIIVNYHSISLNHEINGTMQ